MAILARRAGGGAETVRDALDEALQALPPLRGLSPDDVLATASNADLDEAVLALARLSPGAIRRFLEACAFAIERGGTTTVEAARLLRTLSNRLGVELPDTFRS